MAGYWRIGLLVLVVVCVGCDNPTARKHIARRQENMRLTGETLVKRESNRDKPLGRTMDHFRRQHEEDIARTRENPVKIQQWLEDDFRNWQKQQPAYRQFFHEQNKGNPANIERTLPVMLY